MRRVSSILILTTMVTTLAAANPGPGEKAPPVATAELNGTILSVTPSIPFASATLRVAGPESYEAITWSRGEPLVVDLAVDGFPSDSEHRGFTAGLPDGRYGYEVVFHLADGKRTTHDGILFVEGGVSREPGSDSQRPSEVPDRPHDVSNEILPYENVSAAGTVEHDFVRISDEANDGTTTLTLSSPAGGNDLRVENVVGELQFGVDTYEGFRDVHPMMTLEPISDTQGRLGIGTTQPNADLHIFSPAGVIRITDSDPCSGVFGDPSDPSAWEIEEDFGKLMFEMVPNCPGDPAGGKMWITPSGNVGIGTSSPAAPLTIHHEGHGGDVRLTGAGQSYTLGIRGGSGDFVIQGAGGIGQDAFRITPDAFDEAMTIGAGGVGIGTASPQTRFHVTSPASTSRLRLQAGSGFRDFVAFSDGGFEIQGAGGGSERVLRVFPSAADNSLVFHPKGVGVGTDAPAAKLHVVGSAILEGDVALGSSRTIKHEIEPLNGTEILDAVRELPLYSWKYLDDASQAAHVGPMAEDVYATFRLGRDEKHLSPSDSAGLALAAVQGVDQRLDRELRELRRLVETLVSANQSLASESSALRERLDEIEGSTPPRDREDLETWE